MQEAYLLIRDYFISKEYYEEDAVNNIFPQVINENSSFEKISDDYIKINISILDLKDINMYYRLYTLELKKDKDLIKWYITFDDFGNGGYY